MDVSFASGVVHAALTRPRGRGRYGRGGWERQAGFALLRRAKGFRIAVCGGVRVVVER